MNVSGQLTAAYQVALPVNAFATYATSFKSIGLNLSGVPTDALGRPVLSAATVKPEDVRHAEVGFKTQPFAGSLPTSPLQHRHQGLSGERRQRAGRRAPRLSCQRGKSTRAGSRVRRQCKVNSNFIVLQRDCVTPTASTSRFLTRRLHSRTRVDRRSRTSRARLSAGISRWAFSLGGEYTNRGHRAGQSGEFFGASTTSYRSTFSSSASASHYLVIDEYALINTRVGFRWADGWSVSLWSRNLLDKDYFELLSAAPGNSGLFVGLPGEPRTVGVTLRMRLRSGRN